MCMFIIGSIGLLCLWLIITVILEHTSWEVRDRKVRRGLDWVIWWYRDLKLKFYFGIVGVRESHSVNIVIFLTHYPRPTTLPFSTTSPRLYHYTPQQILLYKLNNRPLKKAVVFVQFDQFQKVKKFFEKNQKKFWKTYWQTRKGVIQ